MEKELTHFFNASLATALRNLDLDSTAIWGAKTAKQMLIHLIQSSKMMHFGNSTLLIKEEYIEKVIAFYILTKKLKEG